MTYKAQLVVRASTKEGVEIIDKVKELAGEEGLTFSDMAVELLGRAIRGETSPRQASSTQQSLPTADPEVKKETAVAEVAAKTTNGTEIKAKSADAPLPPEEAGPPVDPTLPPREIVRHYLERRQERGERAAARILVDFFAVAGPRDGGSLKKLLQEEFTEEEFDALMKPVKESEEYAVYTQRAIFGAPSPYSS